MNGDHFERDETSSLVHGLRKVFRSKDLYKQLLACKGSDAQKVLNTFQWLLDSPEVDPSLRRNLVVATQRLSKKSGMYPTCYELEGIVQDGQYPIYCGGFADIYKGRFDGQDVALKVMRISQSTDVDSVLKTISREAILWVQLAHPNVLPTYGVYHFQTRICLVSPWMEAGDVPSFLRNNPGADRVLLATDVARGLHYLHSKGIIHGDLKGSNILIDKSQRARLSDFGLSSISDPEILAWTSILSSESGNGGTVRWQAPELFGVNDTIVKNNEASDVYAWSCVCYEIFTGKIPFFDVSRDSAVIHQVMHESRRPMKPSVLSEPWLWGLTESIWALMEECWRKDPRDRPSIKVAMSRLKPEDRVDNRSAGGEQILSPALFRRNIIRPSELLTAPSLFAIFEDSAINETGEIGEKSSSLFRMESWSVDATEDSFFACQGSPPHVNAGQSLMKESYPTETAFPQEVTSLSSKPVISQQVATQPPEIERNSIYSGISQKGDESFENFTELEKRPKLSKLISPCREGDETLGRDKAERKDIMEIKKRMFWRHSTHPELLRGLRNKCVEGGTFEALVHEMVFATTFLSHRMVEKVVGEEVEKEAGEEVEEKQQKVMEEWKNFASALVLCLPSIVGQAKFEVEFLKLCLCLIESVTDQEKDLEREEELRERVRWLAGEYLRCYAIPADPIAWEEWREKVVPEVAAGVVTTDPESDPAWVQVMHQPLSLLPGSPNTSGFSSGSTDPWATMLLPSECNSQDVITPSISQNDSMDHFEHQSTLWPAGAHNHRIPWTTLEQEGLTRDILLSLDPHLISRSLSLFHRSILDQTLNLTASFILGPENLSQPPTNIPYTSGDELFGMDDNLHWLTKLVLLQILGADRPTDTVHLTQSLSCSHSQIPQQLTSGRDVPPSPQPPPPESPLRAHWRSEIVSIWAHVCELSRIAGDECTFHAIAAALISHPVARLTEVWRRVDRLTIEAVNAWVYPATDTSNVLAAVKEPKVTMWGGDLRFRAREALGRAVLKDGQGIRVPELRETRDIFEEFRMKFKFHRIRSQALLAAEVSDDSRRMVMFWQGVAQAGGSENMAVEFQRVKQFMPLSLAAEPRQKGFFEPHFWTRPTIAGELPRMPLLPLVFPQPMPTVCLIDHEQLRFGRVDRDASSIQLKCAMDPHRHQLEDLKRSRLPADYDHRGLNPNWEDTVIPLYNGDLLLAVPVGQGPDESRARQLSSSQPPCLVGDFPTKKSESPFGLKSSISMEPGVSLEKDRETSVALLNSLPSTDQQNCAISKPLDELPLRVVVQAGTLDILVGILVHGLPNVSVSVADEGGGEGGMTHELIVLTRKLVVDRAEFAKIWWRVFRSFVNPLAFFELLQKYITSSQPVGSIDEHVHVLTAQTQVLETIDEWLTFGGGVQDALDDVQLFHALQSFLDNNPTSTNQELEVYEAKNITNPIIQQCKSRLTEARESLLVSFNCQTKRPKLTTCGLARRTPSSTNGTIAWTRTLSMREPPDIDRFDAQEFADNLNGMACAAFSNVLEEELYITADLLEVLLNDRIAWFSVRKTSTLDSGTVDIQNIYTHIQNVNHSPLISGMTQDSLYRMLPPGIRTCIRAFFFIQKWIISKIVAPRLGFRARQARMELLLRVIEIARWRNLSPGPEDSSSISQPCVRSFVEAVTTSAVLSVESRLYSGAWQSIALSRGVSCDSLAAFFSRPSTQMALNKVPLIPDMGWILERILEIISEPDIVPSVSAESHSLVNFDKRRYLCNLIANAPMLPSLQGCYQPDELNERGFERLKNLETEVIQLEFDHQRIQEEAVYEASQCRAISGQKLAPPFQQIVVAQKRKDRDDRYLRKIAMAQQEKNHCNRKLCSPLQKEKLPEPRQERKIGARFRAFWSLHWC